ncbi:MAG: TetR/AcrR family transcriptional regulator [Bacillota bacterium]
MPKIVDHDLYREELLSRCFDLFSKKGYSGVTMREIAKELGVSTGTIYHYFPNKKSLLDNLILMIGQRQETEFDKWFGEENELDQILKALHHYVMEKEEEFQRIILLAVDYYRNSNSKEDMEIFREVVKYFAGSIGERLGMDEDIGFVIMIFFSGLIFYRLLCPGIACYEKQGILFMELLRKYMSEYGGD